MEEGVRFAEGLTPRRGRAGRASAMRRGCACKRADGTEARAARARDPGRRRHAAQHRAGARGPGASGWMAGISRPSTRTAPRSHPARARQAGRAQVLMHRARRWPLHQLLRRPAPELLRQRRQGDGRRQARLSGGVSACWRRVPATPVSGADLIARCRDELRATRARGESPDADHRRSGGARARRRARLPSRPVLPVAELRDAGAAPDEPASAAPCWRWRGWR